MTGKKITCQLEQCKMLTGRSSRSLLRPNTASNVSQCHRKELAESERPRTAGNVDRVNSRYSTQRRYHLNCTDRNHDNIARKPSIQDIERQKYSFKPGIRPQSAPQTTLSKKKRLEILSSKFKGGKSHIKCSISKE